MGESKIGWLNPPPFGRTALFGTPAQPGYTFNAWIGCAKVKPECKFCYAEREAERCLLPEFAEAKRLRLPVWGVHAPRHLLSEASWRNPVKWNRLADAAGYPRWCFGGSQMDWLEDRDDLAASRARLLDLIERTPFLRWVMLTKRPEDFARLVPRWASGVPKNVWIGISAGSQASLDSMHNAFAAIPCDRKVISAEPLLERTDFRRTLRLPGVRWFLIGGENAAKDKARPNNLDWMRDGLAQALEVPTIYRFCKQLGSRVFGLPACPECGDQEGEEWHEGDYCSTCGDTVEVELVNTASGKPVVGRAPGDGVSHPEGRWQPVPGTGYARVLHTRQPKGEDWREWPIDLQVQEWPDGAAFVREETRAAC